MNPPPPMPAEYASVTPRVAAAATAASTALPPSRSTSRPAAEASRSTVAIAPPVPVATGCLVSSRPPLAGAAGAVAARNRAARRAASRARLGRRFIAGPPAGCDGSPRSLVHHATFRQVCPSSDCLLSEQVVQGLLGLPLGPGDQVVEAGGLLAAGHGLAQGVLAAEVLAGDQQVVQGGPRLALQAQPDGGQGGRLVGLKAVVVVELGQGQLGPSQQLPVGGAEVVGGLGHGGGLLQLAGDQLGDRAALALDEGDVAEQRLALEPFDHGRDPGVRVDIGVVDLGGVVAQDQLGTLAEPAGQRAQ